MAMADTPCHAIAPDFPFRIEARLGPDGQPVMAIDTSGAPEYRDAKGEPYLRIWRDDDLVEQYEGREPFSRPGVPSIDQIAAELRTLAAARRSKR